MSPVSVRLHVDQPSRVVPVFPVFPVFISVFFMFFSFSVYLVFVILHYLLIILAICLYYDRAYFGYSLFSHNHNAIVIIQLCRHKP